MATIYLHQDIIWYQPYKYFLFSGACADFKLLYQEIDVNRRLFIYLSNYPTTSIGWHYKMTIKTSHLDIVQHVSKLLCVPSISCTLNLAYIKPTNKLISQGNILLTWRWIYQIQTNTKDRDEIDWIVEIG